MEQKEQKKKFTQSLFEFHRVPSLMFLFHRIRYLTLGFVERHELKKKTK